jgi:hypothetical protein
MDRSYIEVISKKYRSYIEEMSFQLLSCLVTETILKLPVFKVVDKAKDLGRSEEFPARYRTGFIDWKQA